MSDIAAFLTARLDEDEAAAKSATPGTWLALDGGVQSANDETQWPVGSTESVRDREDRVHIARHDPARVLADVAAKRVILAHHEAEHDLTVRDGKYVDLPFKCAVCFKPYPRRGTAEEWPCPTVRHLATPYADHPDYDQSWRP